MILNHNVNVKLLIIMLSSYIQLKIGIVISVMRKTFFFLTSNVNVHDVNDEHEHEMSIWHNKILKLKCHLVKKKWN